MKVIDLLNKIANGEEVPEKIKYRGTIYCFQESDTFKDYIDKDQSYGLFESVETYSLVEYLTNEIEIIEEPKKIEKLNENTAYVSTVNNIGVGSDWSLNEKIIVRKLNEIIDYIKKGE